MNNNQPFLSIILLLGAFAGLGFSANGYAGDVSGQVEVLKKGGRAPLESFAYTVVSLIPKGKPVAPLASAKPIIVNQKGKRFFPRVLPIVKGQVVHFYNLDELDHNVFSTDEKYSFDLGRYPKGDFRPVTFNVNGNYKVYCNIHQDMILDIVVLDNQYFATTDEQGKYTLSNVPPGDYQLKIWHIYGGEQVKDITVTEQGLEMAAVTLVSTKVIREIESHKNKHGKDYKKNRGRYRR